MQPVDDVVLMILGTDAAFGGRLQASLSRRKVPAIFMEDQERYGFRSFIVRILGDDDGSPLRWATHTPGRHGLEPFDRAGLVEELSIELGCLVESPFEGFDGTRGTDVSEAAGDAGDPDDDGDAELENAACAEAFSVSAFTWYTPGDTDIVSVLARQAGEAFVVCPAGSGYVAEPTESPDSVFDGGTWAAKGGLFLARSAGRRGVGFYSKREPVVVHWWDEVWTVVDPAKPWETDVEGLAVRDYLDMLLPVPEPEPWIENFALDAQRAEELRILFRHDVSDENTFDRVVSAVGLPPLLAEVASGRTRLLDVEGAETIHPSTMWQAMKDMAREEWERPVEFPAWAAPLKRWQERRRRRSAGYLALMGTAFLGVAVLLAVKLADGAGIESVWWRFAVLGYCILDVAWPRRAAATEPETPDPAAPRQA